MWRVTILQGLKSARAAELKAFKPKPEFYPLFTVFGVALGTVVYCSYRALAHNPDVHLTAAHKHDEMHESGITQRRAKAYYDSLFRKAWCSRTEDGEYVDTHIHVL